MRHIFKQHTGQLLCIFIVVGAFLRLYNLNWGAPYYFHPDERNIAASITHLAFPNQMNPNFFAYGSLPIYLIYFTGIYTNFLTGHPTTQLSFPTAIVLSRFYTSLFSILLIPLLYFVGKKLADVKTGLIAAFLGTFCVGFIQFAHFGTFEMWLTFGSLLLFYLCLLYRDQHKIVYVLLLGFVFGLLCAVKVSSATLGLGIIGVLFLQFRGPKKIAFQTFLGHLFLIGLVSLLTYFLTNPYVIKDTAAFQNSMHYESGVALGTIPVFYTGEFAHTIPVVYPFLHVYPFLLNPLLTVFFLCSLWYLLIFKKRTPAPEIRLLLGFLLILFFSQAFLYVQWTRYYVPTLPFMLLCIAFMVSNMLTHKQQTDAITSQAIVALVTMLFAVSYFITAFIEPDTRLQALRFARNHISPNAAIVSEVYDLGVVPFNDFYPNITLYNFYDLDSDTKPDQPLSQVLSDATYILLPSQRILKPRMLYPSIYPEGNDFYTKLTNGELGFKRIYETPCSVWCTISYLGNPIYSYEGTASVFDRPTIQIYQKQ